MPISAFDQDASRLITPSLQPQTNSGSLGFALRSRKSSTLETIFSSFRATTAIGSLAFEPLSDIYNITTDAWEGAGQWDALRSSKRDYNFEEFIPDDLIEFADLYRSTKNPMEAMSITSKIRVEQKRDIRHAAQMRAISDNPKTAIAAIVGSQFLDPVNYIPIINIASKAKTASSGMKILTALRISDAAAATGKLSQAEKFRAEAQGLFTAAEAAGDFSKLQAFKRGFVDLGVTSAVSATLQETAIQVARDDKTIGQSLLDVTVSAMAGGFLAGGIEMYGVKNFAKVKKTIETDLKDAFEPINKTKRKTPQDYSLREALDIPTPVEEVEPPNLSPVKRKITLTDTVYQKEYINDFEFQPGVKGIDEVNKIRRDYEVALSVRNNINPELAANKLDPNTMTTANGVRLSVKEGQINLSVEESSLDDLAKQNGMSKEELSDRISFVNTELAQKQPITLPSKAGGLKSNIVLTDKDINPHYINLGNKDLETRIGNLIDMIDPKLKKVKKEVVKELSLDTIVTLDPKLIPDDAQFPTEWSSYKIEDTPVTEIMVETSDGLKPLIDPKEYGTAPTGLGLEKFLGYLHFNPNLYMYSRAQSSKAKLVYHRLFNTAFKLNRNMDLKSSNLNVETAAAVRKGRMGMDLNELLNKSWIEYVTGRKPIGNDLGMLEKLKTQAQRALPGQADNRIGFEEFKEAVTKTVRRRWNNAEYKHPVEQVNRAADQWTKNFKEILDEGAKTGVDVFEPFKEIALNEKWVRSYVPQLYDITYIAQNREMFAEQILNYLVKKRKLNNEQLTPELLNHLHKESDGIIDTLMLERNGELRRFAFNETGFELPRQLDFQNVLNDEELSLMETFLVNDPEKILSSYTRSIVPDLELAKVLNEAGLKSVDELLEVLKKDYEIQLAKAPKSKRNAILREMNNVIGNNGYIPIQLQKLRGQYKRTQIPVWDNITNVAKNWAFSTKMGGVLRSSVPDIGRIPFELGFKPLAKPLMRISTAMQETKGNMNMLARIAGINDVLSSDRTMQMMNLSDADIPITALSKPGRFFQRVERMSKNVADAGQTLSLINHWNQFWKTNTGYFMNDIALDTAFKALKGETIDPFILNKLSENFISAEDLFKITDEFNGGGGIELKGVKFINIDKWKDKDLAQRYSAMINRQANKTVTTPNIGDRPFLFDIPTFTMFAQFRSFTIASTNAVLISGLQEKQSHMLLAAMFQIGLGSLSYIAAQFQNQRPVTDNPGEFLMNAFDRSGLATVMSEVDTLFNQIPVLPGSRDITGIMTSRQQSINRFNDIRDYGLGAGGQQIFQGIQGTNGLVDILSKGETSELAIRSFVGSIPFQNNIFLKDTITNPVQNYLIEQFGE